MFPKHLATTLLTLLVSVCLALPGQSGEADQQHKMGQKQYRQKKYAQAAASFRLALEDNPQHARSHWGLARSLAALRSTGNACQHGAQQNVIMSHLFKAVRLNGRLKKKIRRDRALIAIHDTFAFQRLLGRKTSRTKDVERILQAVKWYAVSGEKKAPQAGLLFAKRGKFKFWTLDSGPEGRVEHSGKFSVKRSRVFLNFDKPLGEVKEVEGELKQTGDLWLPGLPGPFNDDPMDCPD